MPCKNRNVYVLKLQWVSSQTVILSKLTELNEEKIEGFTPLGKKESI